MNEFIGRLNLIKWVDTDSWTLGRICERGDYPRPDDYYIEFYAPGYGAQGYGGQEDRRVVGRERERLHLIISQNLYEGSEP